MQFINDNVIAMTLEENQLPKQSHIEHRLKRAKPSAPGSYGIPYSAWKASGIAGSIDLHKAMRTKTNGTTPPNGFNNSLGIFPPKGTADDDTLNSVKRSAENTRPLGPKTPTTRPSQLQLATP